MDLLFQRATSISDIADVASEFRRKANEQQIANNARRMCLNCSWADFNAMFVEVGNYILRTRGRQEQFVIDNHNRLIIQQLYLFLTMNNQFLGDLTRGIMLQGKFGAGKTLIMESFSMLHNHFIRRSSSQVAFLTFRRAVELQQMIMEKQITNPIRRPLVIDELGREPKTVMDYGNVRRPLAELLSLRAEIGTLTFGTTNFTLETLSSDDFYGAMVGDRLRSMFNFMVLDGGSRRI